jgi:hypothetical protein
MCFLLVCLDSQGSSYWTREAFKGFLVSFHANFIQSLMVKKELIQ